MSRTIRFIIGSDRLSVGSTRCWSSMPRSPPRSSARTAQRRGDARRRPPQCGAVCNARLSSARRSLEDAIAQGKPEGKVAQLKGGRDAAWSKLIAALVAAGVERR